MVSLLYSILLLVVAPFILSVTGELTGLPAVS